MAKRRLDDALIEEGLAPDRDRAKRMIMAGEVLVDESPQSKAGTLIPADAKLRVRRKQSKFASRAGFKLEAALEHFRLPVEGRIAMDLGASTGGFTDCLLLHGARRVYAVDVGTNQLIYRLRTEPRVVCLEKCHAKHLSAQLVPDPVEALTVDVSFTSLRYVLPFTFPLLAKHAWIIALFKPQFELARQMVGPGGIVHNQDAIQESLAEFSNWVADRGLVQTQKPFACPVKGREGNQEYLLTLAFAD